MWMGLHWESPRLAILRTTKRPVGMDAGGTLRLPSRTSTQLLKVFSEVVERGMPRLLQRSEKKFACEDSRV